MSSANFVQLRLIGGNVVVGWIEICWRGPVPPPDRVMRDPVHMVLPVASEELENAIGAAVTAARSRRQRCRYCGESSRSGATWGLHEPVGVRIAGAVDDVDHVAVLA